LRLFDLPHLAPPFESSGDLDYALAGINMSSPPMKKAIGKPKTAMHGSIQNVRRTIE
jgi:hypothetical protein